MGRQDLYIVDSSYSALGKKLSAYAIFLSDCAKEYIDILNYLKDTAIPSGNIHSQLSGLQKVVSKLPDEIKSVGDKANKLCGNYISEIDEADSFLYGAK
jgi:hypothetical protein